MNTRDLADRDGITAKAEHLGLREDQGWIHDEWRVTLANGSATLNTSYRTGIGHRAVVPMRESDWNNMDRRLVASKGGRGTRYSDRPTAPDAASVLDCLLSDASSAESTFEDWCSDLGCDSDSRKALATYLECQKVARQLRDFLGAKLTEYMEAERL